MLLILSVRLRWNQQMSIGDLLVALSPLDAHQIERIKRSIVDRRQRTTTGRLTTTRILSILLALVVRQNGEEKERILAAGQQNAVVLEVVALGRGRRDELNLAWVRYLNALHAIWKRGICHLSSNSSSLNSYVARDSPNCCPVSHVGTCSPRWSIGFPSSRTGCRFRRPPKAPVSLPLSIHHLSGSSTPNGNATVQRCFRSAAQ